jgi:hypothetical protein
LDNLRASVDTLQKRKLSFPCWELNPDYLPHSLVIGLTVKFVHSFIHSFIPLACAEFDDSLPFSGAYSIPLYRVLFPTTLLHGLFFHLLSPRLAIYFLAYLSVLLFQICEICTECKIQILVWTVALI